MRNSQPRILAINPGTRYIGMAVLQGSELLDWGVKTTAGRWSERKMERIKSMVSRLIDHFHPDLLSIKQLHASRSSPNLGELRKELLELARQRGLHICGHSIQEIEAFYGSGERMNKRKLAELICSPHPALLRLLRREKKSNGSYHMRMFEAVALALFCLRHLTRC